MVAESMQVVRPADKCEACGKQFVQGNKAMCLVKIPDGDHDTLCLPCWAAVMAASIVGMRGLPKDSAETMRKLFLEALALCDDDDVPIGQVSQN